MRACTLGMQMAGELRLSTAEQAELYNFLLMHSGRTVLSLGMAPLIQGDELAAMGDGALRDDTNLLDTLDWIRRYVSPAAPLPTRALNRRGHGESGDSSTYSIEREFEDIAAGVPVYPEGFLDRLDSLLDAGDREGMLAAHYLENVGMKSAELEQMKTSPV